MQEERREEEVFSRKISAGSRNYFFDVKQNEEGTLYLTITESKFQPGVEKPERFRILVYEDKLGDFLSGLREAVDFIKDKILKI
jgi:hypothetical protein